MRRAESWYQTASICQAIFENNRDAKRKRTPWQVWDFLPDDLAAEAKKAARSVNGMRLTVETLHAMRGMFERDTT